MGFIQLHQNNGKRVYVNVSNIFSVEDYGEESLDTGCRIYDADGVTYIREKSDRVVDLIESARMN